MHVQVHLKQFFREEDQRLELDAEIFAAPTAEVRRMALLSRGVNVL